MDEGILTPRGEIYLIPENITISSTYMIKIQSEFIRIAARLLKESDDEHNEKQNPDIIHFEVGSYVLVTQRTQPEARMQTLWHGPLRVLSNKKGEYTLLNLITLKDVKYHMSQLKTFLFNPLHTDPTDVARRDYLFVEVYATTDATAKADWGVRSKKAAMRAQSSEADRSFVYTG